MRHIAEVGAAVLLGHRQAVDAEVAELRNMANAEVAALRNHLDALKCGTNCGTCVVELDKLVAKHRPQ